MRVVVVSTHRSDKGHYAPLLRCLRATPELEVVLYAVNDFYARPDYDRSIHLDNSWRGKNARGFDAGIVLGDRYEMLVAAAQLVEARIPLLHIHGGEHTFGSLDERWRWAMTAIADVHCVATDDAGSHLQDALAACGVRETRIVVTGAPGLDGITDRQPYDEHEHFDDEVLVHYNPAMDEDTTAREWEAISDAVNSLGAHYFWIKPNGDRFSDVIPADDALELEPQKYRDLLAHVKVIVGNSSAGIIEAPSLGTWTVNVGERQAGRPRAASVIDVLDLRMVWEGISVALSEERAVVANPYGDGHASERIRDVLLGMMSR